MISRGDAVKGSTKEHRARAGRWRDILPALFLAAVATARAAESAAQVTELSLKDDQGGTYRLMMKISGAPSSSFRLRDDSGSQALVVEISPADSSLKAQYDFPEGPLGPIKVSSLPASGPKGIRLEVPLRNASLRGWGMTPDGMEILLWAKPAAASPPGNAYLLGVGDRLEITVFGQDELKSTVEVLADGTAIFPLIGVLSVSGRPLSQVRGEVQSRLKEFLVDPQVSLDIKEYQSQRVNVVGEVQKPGTYYLKGPTTLMDIMALAGWLKEDAGSEIIITRHVVDSGTDGATRQITIHKNDLLRGGGQSNPRLEPGDVITVGPKQYFYIRGEVMKPGEYDLTNEPTLMKAVSIGGGLTPYARKKGIEIIRNVNGSQTKLVFDLKLIEERKAEDIPLLPGDIIIVPKRLF
jgi:polysaccharide export outer membrane protein